MTRRQIHYITWGMIAFCLAYITGVGGVGAYVSFTMPPL